MCSVMFHLFDEFSANTVFSRGNERGIYDGDGRLQEEKATSRKMSDIFRAYDESVAGLG